MTRRQALSGAALEVCPFKGKKERKKRMRTRRMILLVVTASLTSAMWAQNGATQTQERGKAQAPPAKALGPEDAEIQRLQEQHKRLLKQKEIENLRKENEQLESGGEKQSNAQAPSAKPLNPEDAEIQRLDEERQRLLKEQEIEKLRKQNDALKAPPPTAPPPAPPAQAMVLPKPNCAPQEQQGPKVTMKAPPKAATWACVHLGICTNNKPVVLNPDNGCNAAPAIGQPTK
jgi:hypothetical protein